MIAHCLKVSNYELNELCFLTVIENLARSYKFENCCWGSCDLFVQVLHGKHQMLRGKHQI